MPDMPKLPVNSKLRRAFELTNAILCSLLYYPYLVRYSLFLRGRPRRLQIGCGKNRFDGWINADISPRSDLIIFVQRKLPFQDNSLQRIYMEHVLEHVSYPVGMAFLREALRVLQPGGVIRIAMPDLDDLIEGYCEDWRRFDWMKWPEYSFIKTRAEMINIAFRWWGHRHLYNREELARTLTEAGFRQFSFVENGESSYKDLQGLETRLDSKLVVEAVKD
jgi:predicted SAM-dependent methyltransferase